MKPDEIIEKLGHYQVKLFVKRDGNVEPAAPVVLAENLLLIRGLLIELVDKVYESDRDYRLSKSARFDKLIKDGMKPSPARDQLELEQDLIQKKVFTERLRNYMKYIDGLCTSVQSVLKVQTGSDKNNY